MVIDLYPKSAFSDGSGNTLADEPPQKERLKIISTTMRMRGIILNYLSFGWNLVF